MIDQFCVGKECRQQISLNTFLFNFYDETTNRQHEQSVKQK